MRVHNKGLATKALVWIAEARMFLKDAHHKVGTFEVSVNEVYEGIRAGDLAPPPKGTDIKAKRDMLMSVVFKTEYYYNTGDKVVSVKPESKGRKVVVWKYSPVSDSAGLRVTKVHDMTASLLDW